MGDNSVSEFTKQQIENFFLNSRTWWSTGSGKMSTRNGFQLTLLHVIWQSLAGWVVMDGRQPSIYQESLINTKKTNLGWLGLEKTGQLHNRMKSWTLCLQPPCSLTVRQEPEKPIWRPGLFTKRSTVKLKTGLSMI